MAALLTREKGDMNAVVQCILEEPAEAEDEATSKTLEMTSTIDLSDEPDSSFEKSIAIDLTEECDSSPRPTYITYERVLSSVGEIDVEASTLADILATVREKELEPVELSAEPNLLSFCRPNAASSQFATDEPNESSKQLSWRMPRVFTSDQDYCPYCKVAKINAEEDKFCSSCGGVFNLNVRW